jgi:hypothetical protein
VGLSYIVVEINKIPFLVLFFFFLFFALFLTVDFPFTIKLNMGFISSHGLRSGGNIYYFCRFSTLELIQTRLYENGRLIGMIVTV